MAQEFNKQMQTLPLEKIPDYMNSVAIAGSTVNTELMQSLCVRITREAVDAIQANAKVVSNSTDRLSNTISEIAAAGESTSKQLISLNKHLAAATWAMVGLTLVLAIVAVIQILK